LQKFYLKAKVLFRLIPTLFLLMKKRL